MLLAKDEHQAIAEQLVRREISLNDAYKKAQNKEPAKPSDDLVHQCSEIERILKEAARAAFGGTSVGITVKATRGDLVSISVKGLSGTNVRESLSGYGDFLHKATTTPKPTKRPARRSRPSIKPPTKKKAPQASRLRPKKAAKRK
ncbi:MAG: hypothetical protein M5R36_28335 [Deltaproteobacteria bacterium]|nr:hypothetical protein [Deltaproteobacteria bacterium]